MIKTIKITALVIILLIIAIQILYIYAEPYSDVKAMFRCRSRCYYLAKHVKNNFTMKNTPIKIRTMVFNEKHKNNDTSLSECLQGGEYLIDCSETGSINIICPNHGIMKNAF